MTSTITLCENALDSSTWETFEDVGDVREFLVEHFGIWPETARIYLDHVANNADITPFDEKGIERLGRVHGHFYVVVYPGIPLAFVIIAIVMAALSIALTFLLRPHTPNNNEQSANNQLGNRQNQARPVERIPDIFGQLWATFDLLAVPYRTYVNNVEIEHCYMCIGRGSYDIATIAGNLQIRDDIVPLAQIDGASAGVYAPGTSPNSVGGPSPIATVGSPINELVKNIKDLSFVNGQVLPAPNLNSVLGSVTLDTLFNLRLNTQMRFEYPNLIRNDGHTDFTQIFTAGDMITVGGLATDDDLAVDPAGTIHGQAVTVTIAGAGAPFDGLQVVTGIGANHPPGHDTTHCFFTFNLPSSASYGPTRINGSTYLETGHSAYSGMDPVGLIFYRSGNKVWCYYNNYGVAGADPQLTSDVGNATGVHLGGTYESLVITATTITFFNPVSVNPNWAALAAFGGGAGISKWGGINLIANGTFEQGPFVLLNADMTEVWFNFLCEAGCYLMDKDGHQHGLTDTIQVGIKPCDATGAATGAEKFWTATITGNEHDRQYKGTTLKAVLPVGFASGGGVIVRAKRTNWTDRTTGHTVVDEVKWKNCYSVSPVLQPDFGDVTTIQTIIRPTPNALAIKQRKMNALVTRQVPALVGGVFTGLVGSKNAADILCAMALDSHIGNRSLDELDVTGIYATAGPGGEIETYYAVQDTPSEMTEFCYTFDDSKISFEESVGDIALAISCVAYRRGSVLTLSFEKKTANSTLLFNHRNKVPGSETRAFSFGTPTDNDGINVDYIEPNAPNYPNLDTTETLYYPVDQSAVNPKKVTLIGVRNARQANILGWRIYQKLLYQNTVVQFDATEEAALLVLQDRILVADNTRSDTQDGEVVKQVVLALTLSQKVVFDGIHNYTIFLQMPDGTVESIGITAGSTDHEVILASAPSIPCIVDSGNFAKTTYQVVSDAPTRTNAFLLSEKNPKDGKIYELKAVNYDDAYYDYEQLPTWVTPPPPLPSPLAPGEHVLYWPVTGPVTLYNPGNGTGTASGSGQEVTIERQIVGLTIYNPKANWNAPICAHPPIADAKMTKIYAVTRGSYDANITAGLANLSSPTVGTVYGTFVYQFTAWSGVLYNLLATRFTAVLATAYPWSTIDLEMSVDCTMLGSYNAFFKTKNIGFLIYYTD